MHYTTHWCRRFQSYLSVGFQRWAENSLLPLAGSWFLPGSGSPAAFLVLKTLHEWGVSRGPHKPWAWSLTSLIGTRCHAPGCFLQKLLMVAKCCYLEWVCPSPSLHSPALTQSLQNLRCVHLSVPLCMLSEGLGCDFWQKSANSHRALGEADWRVYVPWFISYPEIPGAQGNYLSFRWSQEMTTTYSCPIHG